MNVINLTLPYPPSVNQTWKHGKATGRVYLSKDVRAFREAVAGIVRRCGADKKLTCDLSYSANLYPTAGRDPDTDNHLKAVWDALESAGVFLNDRQIKHIKDVWMCEPVATGYIEIKLEEICIS